MTNKPWLEPDLLDFWKGKKKVKLKAWLSLVLSSFRGKPGWNLPWKSGNSGFDWKIFNRKCACWLNEVLKGEWSARREREMGWKKMGWKRVACSFWIDSLSLRLNTYLTQFRLGFFSLPVTGDWGGRGEGALEGPLSISSKQIMLQSYGHQNYTVQCTYHLQIQGITWMTQ